MSDIIQVLGTENECNLEAKKYSIALNQLGTLIDKLEVLLASKVPGSQVEADRQAAQAIATALASTAQRQVEDFERILSTTTTQLSAIQASREYAQDTEMLRMEIHNIKELQKWLKEDIQTLRYLHTYLARDSMEAAKKEYLRYLKIALAESQIMKQLPKHQKVIELHAKHVDEQLSAEPKPKAKVISISRETIDRLDRAA